MYLCDVTFTVPLKEGKGGHRASEKGHGNMEGSDCWINQGYPDCQLHTVKEEEENVTNITWVWCHDQVMNSATCEK